MKFLEFILFDITATLPDAEPIQKQAWWKYYLE